MEIWQLRHPEIGLIEVQRGYDAEFRELYPGWPEEPADKEITHVGPDASMKQRVQAISSNPPVRLQVLVDGQPRRRLENVPDGFVPLQRFIGEKLSEITSATVPREKPHLNINTNMFKELLSIEYREGSQVVEFDPPPGTRGAKRREAMESSAFKRVAIPLLSGLGKGGWALAMLVLIPLITRFVDWLLSFLPDWELPSLPAISLPTPNLPQITLPVPSFPDINFPQVDVPEWVLFLLEYSKVWIPVLIGIVIGVLALRNYRKSEKQKQQWRRENVPTLAGHERHERAD